MQLEKKQKRAWRRHHRERMIGKAERLFRSQWCGYSLWVYQGEQRASGDTIEAHYTWARERACRVYGHLKVCSCYMCGNPRRHAKGWHRLTMQEHRALSQELDQLDDYYSV